MSSSPYSNVLKKFPLSICVVTVGRGGVENALTVSWASPVSFNPLHFMIAVDTKHYSVEFLDSTKNFVINLLKKDQSKLA
ncbi:MAG: flavin reductase, partial [Candidatus Latescibacterota bacterium]